MLETQDNLKLSFQVNYPFLPLQLSKVFDLIFRVLDKLYNFVMTKLLQDSYYLIKPKYFHFKKQSDEFKFF